MDEHIKMNITRLVSNSNTAVVSSVDNNYFPNMKAMFIAKHEGIRTFWFSTNVSSARFDQWRNCPNAGVYFCDFQSIHGLMLLGLMDIYTDDKTKADFWHEGDEKYYPLGPTDPDYCIIRFTAKGGNYWENEKYTLDSSLIQEI